MVQIKGNFSVQKDRLILDDQALTDPRKDKLGVKTYSGFMKFIMTIFCRGMTIKITDDKGVTKTWFVNKNSYKNWHERIILSFFKAKLEAARPAVLTQFKAQPTRKEVLDFLKGKTDDIAPIVNLGKDFCKGLDPKKVDAEAEELYKKIIVEDYKGKPEDAPVDPKKKPEKPTTGGNSNNLDAESIQIVVTQLSRLIAVAGKAEVIDQVRKNTIYSESDKQKIIKALS